MPHGKKLAPSSFALCLGLLCVLSPASSFAQDDDDVRERFSALAVEAKQAFDEGDYELAIERLQQANMLMPDDRVMFNIGTSYEKLDDCARALAYYDAALRVTSPTEGWPARIKTKISELEPDCPDYTPDSLTGRISITASPENARVYIDGRPIGRAPIEVVLLEQGRHEFRIKLDGYETIEETVALGARADLELNYVLKEIPDEEGGDTDGIATGGTVEGGEGGASANIPALALIGVGALGLGVGSYLNWFRLCRSDRCYYRRVVNDDSLSAEERADLPSQRQRDVIIMATSTTVGALLLVGGASWLIFDKVSSGESDSAMLIAPSIAPDGAGVQVSLRF